MAQHLSSDDTIHSHSIQATYYSDKFIGRKTSSGEIFKQNRYTAAHKTLRMGTLVLVTNPRNNKQVIVKINDRCPKAGIIDLTKTAARAIDVGSAKVTIHILPNRYLPYWENQADYYDVLQRGEFLAMVNTTHTPQSPPVTPATPQQSSGNSKANKQEQMASDEDNKDALFDLILCETNFQSDARKAIANLPLYYQDMAEIELLPSSPKVSVRLKLSMKKPRAESIRHSLKSQYPQCRLQRADL